MTPYRSHGRGTLMLDRRFGKVLGDRGRVQVASGTTDVKVWRALNVMLDQFARRRPELLEDIRDGRLHPMRAYRFWANGEWENIPTGAHIQPLVETVDAWATPKRKDVAERSRAARLSFVRLLRHRARAGATLQDLPRLLEQYRKVCEAKDTASAFNHMRAYARAFLRDTLKKSDRLYLAVADLLPIPETPKFGRNPQTPAGALAIADALGPEAGAIWLTMCHTGMGPKELWDDGFEIDHELEAVRIFGRKTPRRRRLVPLVALPVVPRLTRSGFKSALRRCGIPVAPYDARRTFSVWMVEAGIPQNRREYYRGHAPITIGQLYEQPDASIRAWLREDGVALRAYLNLERPRLTVVG